MTEPVEKMVRVFFSRAAIVLTIIALAVLFATCGARTAYGQNGEQVCNPPVGFQSHTWVFQAGASDEVQPGDELRAYSSDSTCVGASAWPDVGSASVNVVGTTNDGSVLLEPGDPITWRISQSGSEKDMRSFQLEDSPMGPPEVDYTPDWLTIVSAFDVDDPEPPPDSTYINVGFDEARLRTTGPRWSAVLDISAPPSDTTTSLLVMATGPVDSARVSAGYQSNEGSADTLRYVALGTAIYGGALPNGILLSGPAPPPARSDTVRLVRFEGTVNAAQRPARTLFGGRTLVIERFTVGDVTGDGVIDFSDVGRLIAHLWAPQGGRALDSDALEAADMNGDGDVGIGDAFLLFRSLL